jgi:hypothetical protein
MNIAELKSAWNEYDDKLRAVHSINDKIILSMIRERSKSRFSRIENMYRLSLILNTIWILIITATLLTNPFDFNHPAQYIPMIIVDLSLFIFSGISIISYLELRKVNLYRFSLEESLKKIIPIFEKPWKYIQRNTILIMAAATSFPLSFLPRAIETVGLWKALIYELSPIIVVVIVIYFISQKTGLLNERYASKFKTDLDELRELKAMSAELMN